MVYGAEADPYGVVLLRIFPHGDGESDALDAQRFIDQSLSIALDEVETLHLLSGDGEIGGMRLRYDIEFLAHHMSSHTNAPLAEIVVYVAVDLVFVEAFGEQKADDIVDIGVGAVECERASIGHHAAVDGRGKMPAE